MMKSCSYCGRSHPMGAVCPMKPKRKRSTTYRPPEHIERFRGSGEWHNKRAAVVERDMYICRWCVHLEPRRAHKRTRLSVHHIEPLVESFDARLQDDNLITLCGRHHEDAEAGLISRSDLHELAAEPVRLW